MGSGGSRSGKRETFNSSDAKYLQDRYYEERSQDDAPLPYEGTHQDPLGEETEVAYIGKTRLFSEAQNDTARGMLGKRHPKTFLLHHVPLDMRGNYKIPASGPELGERVHPSGYALCNGFTQTHNSRGEQIREEGNPCRGKAQNRSGFCSRHGGMLHPLDRKRIDWDKAPRHIRFKYGKLPVEELDDEELSRGQIRKEDGSFTSNQFVSAEIHDAMVKKLFDRADEKMRNNLLEMVDVFTEIAKGSAYEPADRLKAAEFVFKWLRGQTPVKVEIGVDKPFEQVLDAIFKGGSRAEARAARGEETEDDFIEGEVVDDHELDEYFIQEEIAASQELTPEEEASHWSYEDPEDHRISRDFEPEPVVSYGPAGKETTDPPFESDRRSRYNSEMVDHVEEAELKKKDFVRKRKTPQQVAEERAAFKKDLRKGYAQRAGARKRGYDTVYDPEKHGKRNSNDDE